MKVNKLQSFWIVTQSVAVTLFYSLRTLGGVFWASPAAARAHVDHISRAWSKQLLRIIKLSYTVHNPHHFVFEPGRRYIVMSNHSSHYDIPLIFMALPGSIRMIAKKELFRFPVWGQAMKAGEFISVDRRNSVQAFRDLEIAKEKMETGIILWIAPEGTRSETGELGPFKKGGFMLALQTDATILPVAIEGSHNILPKKTFAFRLGQHVDIYIGKPIQANAFSVETRDALMQKVREGIQAASY